LIGAEAGNIKLGKREISWGRRNKSQGEKGGGGGDEVCIRGKSRRSQKGKSPRDKKSLKRSGCWQHQITVKTGEVR